MRAQHRWPGALAGCSPGSCLRIAALQVPRPVRSRLQPKLSQKLGPQWGGGGHGELRAPFPSSCDGEGSDGSPAAFKPQRLPRKHLER